MDGAQADGNVPGVRSRGKTAPSLPMVAGTFGLVLLDPSLPYSCAVCGTSGWTGWGLRLCCREELQPWALWDGQEGVKSKGWRCRGSASCSAASVRAGNTSRALPGLISLINKTCSWSRTHFRERCILFIWSAWELTCGKPWCFVLPFLFADGP